jgi:hypothetical protein
VNADYAGHRSADQIQGYRQPTTNMGPAAPYCSDCTGLGGAFGSAGSDLLSS